MLIVCLLAVRQRGQQLGMRNKSSAKECKKGTVTFYD
jgi:hypothetical protein